MSWLNQLLTRRRRYDELSETIREHLEEKVADLIDRGMKPDQAEQTARREFGNVARIEERSREVWSWNWLDMLARDFWISCRMLTRSPGFSIIAITVMALCIAATTSLFTVVRSVLLRPLPFRNPEQLVMLYEHFRDSAMNAESFNYNPVAPADFFDWRAHTHSFEDMAAWCDGQFNFTGGPGELPEIMGGGAGSANLFPLLGVQPVIGRTFSEDEDRPGGNVVMLAWSIFQRRFAGDASIVGKQIHLDGKPYTVVGVLPKWFSFPDAKIQVWITFQSILRPEIVNRHDYHFARVVARLRPDVSLVSAVGQVSAVQYELHRKYLHAQVAEDVAPRTLLDDLGGSVKTPLTVLLCAAGCMLLIGCLNVANLLVARSASRRKEIAIRSALGARRTMLLREQLIESLLISIAGGGAGVLLSLAGTKWLVSTWKDLPTAQGIHVDGVVLAFVCALVFASVLLAGLLPAISSTSKKAIAALQASSRSAAGSQSRTALRHTLLIVEIATTVVLLIAAGLLLKSFWRLRTADVGCTTSNVLTMGYSLPTRKYDSPEKVNAFNETLMEHVRAMPGVRAATLGSMLPGEGYPGDRPFTILEHPSIKRNQAPPDALYLTVDAEYFRTLQVPLLSGRFFTGEDRAGRPKTVIINRMLAQHYFPGENPIGKHLQVAPQGDADSEVIGVIADTLYQVGKPVRPAMYFPLLDGKGGMGLTLAVRTTSDSLALSIPIQKEIAKLDPELPVSDVLTMRQIIDQSLGDASLSASVVLAFALLSLILASVGLYGVLSYLTTQRTGEIGIRMALGAERTQVLRLMLGDGLLPALYGLIFGLVASAGAVRLIQSMLYGTRTLDPAIFAIVAATLLVVSALACSAPAWKASRVDPMQALRGE